MSKKHNAFKPALLFPSRAIAYVYSQIEQQKQLLQPIRNTLPPALAAQVLHCVVKQKKLIIFTGAATWASQLRFYSDKMLASIAPLTKETVNVLQVKVISVKSEMESRQQPKPNIPSAEKIKLIRNTGLMVSDEQLKQALLKLSNTLQNLSDEN